MSLETVATIAEIGTAVGTLILALATFASVRSGNRSARLAEQSLLEGIRPLLLPSRVQDPEQKVGFMDERWLHVAGGHAALEVTDDAVYMAFTLRNVGMGIAVLNGWMLYPGRIFTAQGDRPDTAQFHRLTRDLYVPSNDTGFWQGAMRDNSTDDFKAASKSIREREFMTVDIHYGDAEGGQRMISRFSIIPVGDDQWITAVSRHWNLDRPDPR